MVKFPHKNSISALLSMIQNCVYFDVILFYFNFFFISFSTCCVKSDLVKRERGSIFGYVLFWNVDVLIVKWMSVNFKESIYLVFIEFVKRKRKNDFSPVIIWIDVRFTWERLRIEWREVLKIFYIYINILFLKKHFSNIIFAFCQLCLKRCVHWCDLG